MDEQGTHGKTEMKKEVYRMWKKDLEHLKEIKECFWYIGTRTSLHKKG